MKRLLGSLSTALALTAGSAAAAPPPDPVNFQGVLRDAAGAPLDGAFDMVFHLYDAAAGGNEILRDIHEASGAGAVAVTGGLFSARLGAGVVQDGPPALDDDPYLLMSQAFKDFTDVWVEIQVKSLAGVYEVLSPRVRVQTVPFAHNATHLGGAQASSFITTSSVAQTKLGSLTVADLTASGNDITFGHPGARITAASDELAVTAGDADGDNLFLTAGNTFDDGRLLIAGNGPMEFTSGDGTFSFVTGTTLAQTASLNALGHLQIDGNLTVSGSNILFGSPGAAITDFGSGLTVQAGDADLDDLLLAAGNSIDDGRISIFGDSSIDLRAGDGTFSFTNGATGLNIALLSSPGNLQLSGDLTVTGNDISFGSALASISANSAVFSITAGDADSDDLILTAGNSTADGRIAIFGLGTMELRAGSGTFNLVDGSSGIIYMTLAGPAGEITFLTTGGALDFFGHSVIRSGLGAEVRLDVEANNAGETADWCANGNCLGANHLAQLQEDGDLLIGGALFQNQFDLAEAYLKSEPMEPGDVVRLDPARKGAVLLSAGASDLTVLGVVSGRPGVVLGGAPFDAERLERMWGPDVRARFEQSRGHPAAGAPAAGEDPEDGDSERRRDERALEAFYWEDFAPVALAGRAPVKVDARFGAIAAGDALSPSPVPGVAMKSDGRGPVIGIALESLPEGRGTVELFLARGQGAPPDLLAAQRRVAEDLSARTPDPATGAHAFAGHYQVVLDSGADDDARFSVMRDGEMGGAASEVFRVDEAGNVFAKGSFRPTSMDLAELFPLGEAAGPGDVLAADPGRPGRFRPARDAGDPAVIGVVAERPGILLGGGADRIAAADPELAGQWEEARRLGDRQAEARAWRRLEERFLLGHAAVALAGTVRVKADAGYGAIKAGDLLASSPTPGHAMRAGSPEPGTVLGKALEGLEAGTGLIRMLVMLR